MKITLESRFDEQGHPEVWRNEVARELNILLEYASWHVMKQDDVGLAIAAKSIAARVASFEEIQVAKP